MYCDLSTASEVFLIFTTQLYHYFSVFFLFELFCEEPEVFLPEYFQTAILYAVHFLTVVKIEKLLYSVTISASEIEYNVIKHYYYGHICVDVAVVDRF